MLSNLNSHEEDCNHNQQHLLLLHCAELIQRSDFPAARHAVSVLTATSSASGDATDRLAHHFARSLSLRLLRLPLSPPPDANSIMSFNKLTPFLRFSHLTANQAILETLDNHHRRRPLHVLDLDIGPGLQWPPLLQAIAGRPHPPPVHITGTGPDRHLLLQTGRRLQSFADSLGLPFRFHPHPLSTPLPLETRISGEMLAVNCVMFLHKLINDGGTEELRRFLRAAKAMNPAVVTVAEREAAHGSPSFVQRFGEAMGYYAAVFDALEATLPASSGERMAVERAWAGREIEDIVAGEGEGRRERHQRFDTWEGTMKAAGFAPTDLSPYALAQARLLLRLHYPSEGYRVDVRKGSIFLGWKTKPLFSVSSWSC